MKNIIMVVAGIIGIGAFYAKGAMHKKNYICIKGEGCKNLKTSEETAL